MSKAPSLQAGSALLRKLLPLILTGAPPQSSCVSGIRADTSQEAAADLHYMRACGWPGKPADDKPITRADIAR